MPDQRSPSAIPPVAPDGRTALAVAEQAVRAAGAIIAARMPAMATAEGRAGVSVQAKDGWNNFVTEVDHQAEAALLAVLDAAFPEFAVLAEESGSRDGSVPWRWTIDPLDGTRNFAAGIPQLAVNLALDHDGEIVLGLTYDPVRDELFHAVLGGGAWLNGQRIRVAGVPALTDALLGFDMGYLGDQGKMLLAMLTDLWPGMQSVRMMGTAAMGLAYVACGRFHIYAHHYVQPWDIAPGLLLVREAGGLTTDLRGAGAVPEAGCVVAAAPGVHGAFMAATDGSDWRLSQR